MGCRSRDDRAKLVRLVRRPDGTVALDPAGHEGGRGAYVHARESCLAPAAGRGAIGRALRAHLDAAQVATLMNELRTNQGERA